jgi:hypothetical protein
MVRSQSLDFIALEPHGISNAIAPVSQGAQWDVVYG